jgi:signal transduction histidine kinase
VLEELGLAEALRAEGERRGAQGLHVWVNLDPLPAALSEDTALCLFRVAQEALNNVARHAGARMATVRLREADGGLLLAVSDDGVGFEPASTGKGMHLGLAGMRERLRLVDGSLDIESAPGQGTTIVAWVPEGAAT